jgi:hypothetical protein
MHLLVLHHRYEPAAPSFSSAARRKKGGQAESHSFNIISTSNYLMHILKSARNTRSTMIKNMTIPRLPE